MHIHLRNLHLVAQGAHTEVMVLAALGADVHARFQRDNTLGIQALRVAIEGGHTETVRLLELGGAGSRRERP